MRRQPRFRRPGARRKALETRPAGSSRAGPSRRPGRPRESGATYVGTAWSPDGSRIATLDFPTRTVYTLNAADGSDLQAVHPDGVQFVPGWQPRGTGTEDDG
jgi:hypothetical protein